MSRTELATMVRLQAFDIPAARIATDLRYAAMYRRYRNIDYARKCIAAARRNRLAWSH